MAGRRKHVAANRKRKRTITNTDTFSNKEKKHLRQFGEIHPAEERDTVKKYTKVVEEEEEQDNEDSPSSQSEPEEELSAYQQLVSTVTHKATNQKALSSSESEGEELMGSDDADDDDSDDLEGDTEGICSKNGEEAKANHSELDVSNEEEFNEEINSKEEEKESAEVEDLFLKDSDPFTKHFEINLPDELVEQISCNKSQQKENVKIAGLGRAVCSWYSGQHRQNVDKAEKDLIKLHVKRKLCEQAVICNKKICGPTLRFGDSLTKLQLELFKLLNKYQDVYYPDRNTENGEELRLVYCLHALNHVLKTRSRIVAHSTKIKTRPKNDPDVKDYRDQGLTRPKVVIVLPFRNAALKVVNLLTDLLMSKDQMFVSNRKRFQSEYSEREEVEKKGLKPEDYEAIFEGNIDDHFRIGLGVAKKTLKLYTDFYSSDIILASPLGLRTMIAGDGETTERDFLSSIELLIFDQADIFLMQNWDHILYLMDNLHLQPKEGHGVDFSRVRMWTLNGWAKYYRQTLIFSSVVSPELNSLFNKSCQNYGGKVAVCKSTVTATICQIVVQLPQVFQRVESSSFTDLPDSRFEFFVKKVLPHHKDPVMSQTLIFIPSYFDYVRIRNYFVKEDVEFTSICEYSNNKVISRSRNLFFHGKAHFMLYTERIHFFRRFKLRGVKHILFYGLPVYPHFYSEVCNMMKDPRQNTEHESFDCTVLYSKYEAQRLAAIVGDERTSRMLNSEKSVHMFVTGEES